MEKKVIRLTESDLHNIVKETMDKFLQQQEQLKQWINKEKELYNKFEQFLNRNGVQGAKMFKYRGNSYCISISTQEYKQYDVDTIANRFARMNNMYVTTEDYPATTYIWLNKY